MSENNVQKDLVLSINEYSYVEDETKGHVICWVGPSKTSLSQSDKLVRFDKEEKRFVPCSYKEAINLFTTIPENWYCILKNPAEDNRHPKPGTSNSLPEVMHIGQKINIRGPASFALYPSQMAKVIKGHALRSNQYLLARVYESAAANESYGVILDSSGKEVELEKTLYSNGQILVIKGTEVSFYIPPTGIEVLPIDNNDENGYIRDAVTLERLEYCILKDEDGNKRYVHGPQVVFPEPTETFITSSKNSFIFRAIELSKITGIYVKVIAEYTENDITHPVGEELFITGADQMIYYPRPEHAIISYDGKIVHHATAIPKGEGRYIMNRMTGEIATVKGPLMYLPDPRTEVVVKRKLTQKECELWYPGNVEVKDYNALLTEQAVEKAARQNDSINTSLNFSTMNYIDSCSVTSGVKSFDGIIYATSNNDSLANFESNASISRGTSYTKPRTITLDNKFDGVVNIDVWTGYAVNVISKNGDRKIICGPQSIMLDYDQTLETLTLSRGRPKKDDNLLYTAFLRYENNKVSDVITFETKDFVACAVKLSYDISFDKKHQDKWFSVSNYVKLVCDRMRSIIKNIAKRYTIKEFNDGYIDIIRNAVIDYDENNPEQEWGRFFPENGMRILDCDVLAMNIQNDIAEIFSEHQNNLVEQQLSLAAAEQRVLIAQKLAEAEQLENEVKTQKIINKMNLEREEALRKMEITEEIDRRQETLETARRKAEQDMQPILDAIQLAQLKRLENETNRELKKEKAKADLEREKKEAYAETISKIMDSIAPGLIESLSANANKSMMGALTQAIAPYALASDQGIVDTVDKLLRGTTMESIIDKITTSK